MRPFATAANTCRSTQAIPLSSKRNAPRYASSLSTVIRATGSRVERRVWPSTARAGWEAQPEMAFAADMGSDPVIAQATRCQRIVVTAHGRRRRQWIMTEIRFRGPLVTPSGADFDFKRFPQDGASD